MRHEMVVLDPDQVSLLRHVSYNIGEGLVRADVGVPHRVVVVAVFLLVVHGSCSSYCILGRWGARVEERP